MKTEQTPHSNPLKCAKTAFGAAVALAALLCAFSGLLWPALADGQNAVPAAALPVQPAASTNAPAEIQREKDCRIIYLGFVGALEPAHNKYSPYVWGDGLHWLLGHFPSHAGVLTAEELQRAPKVVLVGHSMGGWAMVNVARKLNSRDIPVELTIQVDSVGFTDYTLPRNINSAAIFHARDVLMPITTKRVRMEDPSHTKLLENVTVHGAGHESITRDPRIRELVMKTIEDLRASFAVNPAAAASIPSAPAQN